MIENTEFTPYYRKQNIVFSIFFDFLGNLVVILKTAKILFFGKFLTNFEILEKSGSLGFFSQSMIILFGAESTSKNANRLVHPLRQDRREKIWQCFFCQLFRSLGNLAPDKNPCRQRASGWTFGRTSGRRACCQRRRKKSHLIEAAPFGRLDQMWRTTV